MKTYFAYLRVSTPRQGEGVSLQEQRSTITNYAAREGFSTSAWFEEKQTAARAGRPVFNQMLELVKINDEAGVILLRVDRGARNLRDWADIGELIDAGVDVRIAGESLDLQTRGGRMLMPGFLVPGHLYGLTFPFVLRLSAGRPVIRKRHSYALGA